MGRWLIDLIVFCKYATKCCNAIMICIHIKEGTMPQWDPKSEVCLDTTVEITLVYGGDAWKISKIQEFWN